MNTLDPQNIATVSKKWVGCDNKPSANVQVCLPTWNDGAKGAYVISHDDLGGINLNSVLIESVLKTNQNGKPLMINGQPVGNIKINDLMPIIIKETPVYNIQSLLGTDENVESITD